MVNNKLHEKSNSGPINYTSTSLEQTHNLARCIAGILNDGSVILLDGQLGAGKTVLAQGIAKSIGIMENITSPTFTIVKEYKGDFKLYHADLYRVSAEDFLDLGYMDEIGNSGVGIIEWGDKLRPYFSEYLNIEIEIIDDTNRIFSINAVGGNADKTLEELKKCLS